MTYTGSITIIDGNGNAVHERGLSPDEIIEALLKRPDQVPTPPIDAEKPAKRHYKKREPKPEDKRYQKKSGAERNTPDRVKKPCCGSTGSRHFKWCKEVGGTGKSHGNPDRTDSMQVRIRGRLMDLDQEGTIGDDVMHALAEEIGVSVHTVKTIAVEMRQRGVIQ